jgi:drug/metabolite transporter (DMT)-like permease
MKAGTHPVVIATAWMAGTLLSFTAVALGARELSAQLSPFEIMFLRSGISLAILTLLVCRSGWRQISSRRLGTHLLRNCAHFAGQSGWFYGIASIPLAMVFALEFTTPVWTTLLAMALAGERLTRTRLLAVGLGLAGMLVILRPGAAAIHPAALAVLLGAVGYGMSHVLTKRLVEVDTPLTILFYMAVVQLPLGFIPALMRWKTPGPAAWPWLLLIGVAVLTAHYCMARALALADAMVVVPLDFLRLPLIGLLGFLFYHERPGGWVFAGAFLMLSGNLLNVRAEGRRLPSH